MADETKIIRIVVDSSKAVDGSAAATRAMERLERQTASIGSSVDRMEKSLGRLGGFMKAQLALAVAEIGARLLQMGKNAFDAASGLDELAEQLGVTNDFLQASQFLAAQSGVKLEQLESAYSKFSQKMGEAADGSKEMIEKLEQLGVKNLDLAGKLRPTQDLLQDVAAGIVAIEDPAKRAAAAVDFFGKSGMKLLPMMSDLAAGADLMTAKMIQAGAYIGPETSKRLDEMADAGERAGLRWRATMAEMIAGTAAWYERNRDFIARMTAGWSIVIENVIKSPQLVTAAIGESYDAAGRLAGDWIDTSRLAFDQVIIAGGRFVAGFAEAIRSIPEMLGKAFVDGINLAIEGLETGLGKITGSIEKYAPWLGVKGGAFNFGRIAGGGASAGDRNAGIRAAEDEAERALRAKGYGRDYRADRETQRKIDFDNWFANQEANYGPAATPATTGERRSGVKGAGEDVMERMRKALHDSSRDLEQARAFAEAAGQGADAVARLEIHFKALKTAQDVFGKAANDNTKGVAELTAKLEEQALATQKLRDLGDFRAGTEALRDQNELLEAEVRLANELPEVRARELAILKTMQDVKAKGLEGENAAIEQRREAIEQNERLKGQADEIRRSNELWTAPLKSALESIQQRTTDWIERMLEGLEQGKFSFEDFGKMGMAIIRRMVAEMMSLAVIRPLLGSVVGGMSSMGLVSPATATSLAYGQGYGGTRLTLPGGGLGNMGSGMGGLGGVGDFLGRPIASLFPSSAPAGGFADVGALLQSGQTGASASASGIGGLGGISIGQGLGAAAGIGMGAFQLATAKNTGQTIGGIGQMIGGAVSLIPGFGQIAGPLIMMASALLPSLIGEPDTRTHNSTNASLRYGAGGYGTSGGAWGPGANVSQSQAALGSIGGNIGAVYDLLGGVQDASKVWGMDLSSWTASGNNWSYTSRATHLVDPSGNRSSWRMNEDNMVDTASAEEAMRSILRGAGGEISSSMRTAVTAMLPATTTLQDVAKGVVFVTDTYEKLGKTVISVEPDFDALTKTFKDMASTATSLGLSLEPVTAEQKKQTERLGQDYVDNLIDPVAAALRAFADEKATILANVEYIDRNTDVIVDMARINEALLRKEAALKEQLYGGAVAQLEDAIKRLSYGNLSNATSAGNLAGMRGSLNATVAQARSGDGEAIGRLAGEITSFGEANRSYFASGPQYEAIRQELLALAREFQLQVSAPSSAATGDPSVAASNNAELNRMMAQFINENSELKQEIATLTAMMGRLVAKR